MNGFARMYQGRENIHFFEKIAKWESHIFMSLQRFLTEVRIFSKFCMINRAVRFIFCLNGKWRNPG